MGAAASSAAAVRAWTADDVAARVTALGAAFAKYEAPIKENGVDGQMLLELEAEALEREKELLIAEEAAVEAEKEADNLAAKVEADLIAAGLGDEAAEIHRLREALESGDMSGAELEQAAEVALSTAMQAAAEAQKEAEARVAAAEERAESHALALKRAAVVARVEAARRAQEDEAASRAG